MIEIVNHPKSGERYIFESTETPGGMVFRAAGPLHHTENPSADEMKDWLDNQGHDAYDDGEWLNQELQDGR